MTWFKVDDKLHSHSKTRKILTEAPAALALWVVAGSWSSDNLTDGFVPDHQLPWLIPVGAEEMARQLVSARFWRRVRGGYLFHEWASDGDGTKRNPTRADVEAERRKKAEAGRKGGLARGKTAPGRGNRASGEQAGAKARASDVLDPPTRPDPTGLPNGSPESPAANADAEFGVLPGMPQLPPPPEREYTPQDMAFGVARWRMEERERADAPIIGGGKKGALHTLAAVLVDAFEAKYTEAEVRQALINLEDGIPSKQQVNREVVRVRKQAAGSSVVPLNTPHVGSNVAYAEPPKQRSTSSQRAADILTVGAQLRNESLNGASR